jgi:ESS family glutamate:Na+ symporter
MINLNLIHAVAFAGVILFMGYGLCRWIKPLSHYNIPAPVVGGLIVARAFLVVPMVGAFFIDFTNALLITVFLNVFR